MSILLSCSCLYNDINIGFKLFGHEDSFRNQGFGTCTEIMISIYYYGKYDSLRNCFIETFESPKNSNPKDDLEKLNKEKFKYYVDLRISFTPRPLDDTSEKDVYDFADVMNLGYPFQNNPDKYMVGLKGIWIRKIEFENVWDRHSCKIYSSIAESSKGYLGNSQIFYQPIKYFKLNSTDQRFWIEFYSGHFHKIPIKIPLNESFVIEIQLLPYNNIY